MNDFVPLSSAGTRPFADFHVADVGTVDGEAQGAAHLVETVAAGSAGVEVKQVVNGVVDDLENVGVPRDEDFRAQRLDPRYGLRGVVAGIAADVGHQDAHPFALEGEKFAVGASHDTSVDIAIDGPQGFERRDLVGDLRRADVPGVPDFVHVLEECFERLVERAVGVGYESYAFHERSVFVL